VSQQTVTFASHVPLDTAATFAFTLDAAASQPPVDADSDASQVVDSAASLVPQETAARINSFAGEILPSALATQAARADDNIEYQATVEAKPDETYVVDSAAPPVPQETAAHINSFAGDIFPSAQATQAAWADGATEHEATVEAKSDEIRVVAPLINQDMPVKIDEPPLAVATVSPSVQAIQAPSSDVIENISAQAIPEESLVTTGSAHLASQDASVSSNAVQGSITTTIGSTQGNLVKSPLATASHGGTIRSPNLGNLPTSSSDSPPSIRKVFKSGDLWAKTASVIPVNASSKIAGVYTHEQPVSIGPYLGSRGVVSRSIIQNPSKGAPEMRLSSANSFNYFGCSDGTRRIVLGFCHFPAKSGPRPATVFLFEGTSGQLCAGNLGALTASLEKCAGEDLSRALKCAVAHHLYETGSFHNTLHINFIEIVAQAQGSRTSRPTLTLLKETSVGMLREQAAKEQGKVDERKRKEREAAELERRKELEESARKKEAKERSELLHQSARAAREESRRRSITAPISIAPAIAAEPFLNSVANDSSTGADTALVVYQPSPGSGATQAVVPQASMTALTQSTSTPKTNTSEVNTEVSELRNLIGSMSEQMLQQKQLLEQQEHRFEQRQQLLQQEHQQRQTQLEQLQQQQQQQLQMQQQETYRTLMAAGQHLESRFANQIGIQSNLFPGAHMLPHQLPGVNLGSNFVTTTPMNHYPNHIYGLGGSHSFSHLHAPTSGPLIPTTFGAPGPFGGLGASSFPQLINPSSSTSSSCLTSSFQCAPYTGIKFGNALISPSSAYSEDSAEVDSRKRRKRVKSIRKREKSTNLVKKRNTNPRIRKRRRATPSSLRLNHLAPIPTLIPLDHQLNRILRQYSRSNSFDLRNISVRFFPPPPLS